MDNRRASDEQAPSAAACWGAFLAPAIATITPFEWGSRGLVPLRAGGLNQLAQFNGGGGFDERVGVLVWAWVLHSTPAAHT